MYLPVLAVIRLIFVSVTIGAVIGIFAVSLCMAGKDRDEAERRAFEEQKGNIESQESE